MSGRQPPPAIAYLGDAYALARCLIGDPSGAEAVVEEAYGRVCRRRGEVQRLGARVWLLTAVREAAHEALARDAPDRSAIVGDCASGATDKTKAGAAQDLATRTKGRSRPMDRAIAALPISVRETLVLREFHSLSYRDIAAVTGVPIAAVASRLCEARQALIGSMTSPALHKRRSSQLPSKYLSLNADV